MLLQLSLIFCLFSSLWPSGEVGEDFEIVSASSEYEMIDERPSSSECELADEHPWLFSSCLCSLPLVHNDLLKDFSGFVFYRGFLVINFESWLTFLQQSSDELRVENLKIFSAYLACSEQVLCCHSPGFVSALHLEKVSSNSCLSKANIVVDCSEISLLDFLINQVNDCIRISDPSDEEHELFVLGRSSKFVFLPQNLIFRLAKVVDVNLFSILLIAEKIKLFSLMAQKVVENSKKGLSLLNLYARLMACVENMVLAKHGHESLVQVGLSRLFSGASLHDHRNQIKANYRSIENAIDALGVHKNFALKPKMVNALNAKVDKALVKFGVSQESRERLRHY